MAKRKKANFTPLVKKLPVNDSEVCEEADNVIVQQTADKKKKLNQQMIHGGWIEESLSEEEPLDIDQLRNPLEEDEHWQLRRAFLAKNQHVLERDELICLAQVYMNIELLHCTYPRETMEQVSKLAEGIGSEYHRKRAFMLKRTFVSASDAAAAKVRRDDPSTVLKSDGKASTSEEISESSSGVPARILNCLRSDLILLEEMVHTIQTFNHFNSAGLKMEANVSPDESGMFEGYVEVGGVKIAKKSDKTSKLAMRNALRDAKEFLSKYCYTLVRKKLPTQLEAVETVSKANISKQNNPEKDKLDSGNVGFQLMAKLGWTGGSLGARGDGIMNPVTVDGKLGRQGLRSSAEGKCDLAAIRQKLTQFRDGKLDEHTIVFASEYSSEERKHIHEIARQLHLKSQSYGNDKSGNRQLVVSRKKMRPSELLRKVMVEKDPTFCEMYEVTPPSEQNE
uniref:NF-kappa-B-repressing factor n=1 Tax=Anopheles epiroticus TaxID=199890 RepID=A0A182PEK8_9DIPT